MDYIKKPVRIQALKWDGTNAGMEMIKQIFKTMQTDQVALAPDNIRVSYWSIKTLEGCHIVSPGDYIIKGLAGEFYPCKPRIFKASYEPIATPV